jgi:hypothetical protein
MIIKKTVKRMIPMIIKKMDKRMIPTIIKKMAKRMIPTIIKKMAKKMILTIIRTDWDTTTSLNLEVEKQDNFDDKNPLLFLHFQ